VNYYRPTSSRQKIKKLGQLFSISRHVSRKPVGNPSQNTFSILMIVPNLDRIGGYEIQAQRLSAKLADLGHLVTVVTNEAKGAEREFRNGFMIRRIGSGIARLFFYLRRRASHAIMHVHGICGFSLFAIRLASHFRIPTVLKVATRGDVSALYKNDGTKQNLYRHWLKKTNCFIAVSEEIANEIESVGVERSRILRVPNFVDTVFFNKSSFERKEQIRQRLKTGADQTVFLCLGRLEKRKGVDILLRAWKNAGVLWIVGNGPEEDRLREFSRELKLQNITFFGATDRPLPFYQAADVFVLPSLAEGAPNVLLEAMSCGLPVIATRIGGIVDQIDHQQQGLLVSAGSSEELSAAMEFAAAHPDERNKWSREAQSRVREKFDIEKITQRYVELYAKLAD
jgi:glycosyltransferase involved in cell wall biosynthesis